MKLFTFLEKRVDSAKPEPVATITFDASDRLAFKKLAFYIATSYISNTISKCEIKRFIKNVETKDELYYLLNISPNLNENASEFKFKFFYHLFFDGEALIVEHKDKLHVADSFGIEEHPFKGNKFTNIAIGTETLKSKNVSDVFYFKHDDKQLASLVESMYNDYAEIVKYSFERFKESASEKYKLELSNIKADDTEFNKTFNEVIKEQLKEFMNNPKAIYPQFQGYNLTKLSNSDGKTDSTDIRNLRKEVFEIVAEAFKIPVSLLYGNMTNMKEIVSSFITFAIEPLTKMMNEEFIRKTGTMNDFFDGTYLKVDTTSIIHIDLFEIADKVEKFIGSGMFNIDEMRHKLDEKPLNTDYSEQHWMTKNFDKIENVMNGLNESKGGE